MNICILGDSITAGVQYSYWPQSVMELMRYQLVFDGTSLATPSKNITDNIGYWEALTQEQKASFDYVFIGGIFNSLGISVTVNDYISLLQTLVDNINSTKKTSCRVIASTITPCRDHFEVAYTAPQAATMYQLWIDVNEAIKGNGAIPLTGVNGRCYLHTDYMKDENNYLKAAYWTSASDKLHVNRLGKDVIADEWLKFIQ